MKYMGIDGCKLGWFFVGLDNHDHYSFGVFTHISELSLHLDQAQLVLIDIPIGLKTRETEQRLCDMKARKLLAPERSSSVFTPPSRCALNSQSYAQANSRNRACTGRGLSAQCWGIVPKIKQVDYFMRSDNRAHKIREMHPEICFWALNQNKPMQHNKKTDHGFIERTGVISQLFSASQNLIDEAMSRYPRKHLARDDVVDALVGAICARHINRLVSLPDEAEKDDYGLPMEIVYAAI